MKDQELIQRFIHLRSQDWTISKIMVELNICRQTVVNWSRKHQFEIQNQKAIQKEALQRQLVSTADDRARLLAERLSRIETELAKRDLSTVSTARLYALSDSLRAQILREIGPIQFTTPVREIPNEEYNERVQDWKP